jgi:hypothetical protein
LESKGNSGLPEIPFLIPRVVLRLPLEPRKKRSTGTRLPKSASKKMKIRNHVRLH